MAGLRVPCQNWELLRHLLRKRREGDHTADTKDWASELGLGGTGRLRTAADGYEMVGFGDHRA